VRLLIRCALALVFLTPVVALGQEAPPLPSSATEPQGFVPEPDLITRATLYADRHLGKGGLTNGIYVDYGNMIPGAGWASAGPGYRHWYGKDSILIDGSASISVNAYKMAQARFELPTLLKSRLGLGTTARWQDFGKVDYFGGGRATTEDLLTHYSINSTQLTAYATLRPFRWMNVNGQIGWMNPSSRYVDGLLLQGLRDDRTFVPSELSMTVDTRDFPGHPTSGFVLRGVGTHYDDRTSGENTFNRYEAEAAAFVPLAGSRIVLALHGWAIRSDVEAGRSVPFYLQPGLGGANSLRSFTDYRFRDDNMLLANAEVRLALMTHLDLALFVDAGNVAARTSDLNLDKRSYGTGFRFHTRRETFAMVDIAYGDEGWTYLFRLKDPLTLSRITKKNTLVPFAP
jgi:Omp85 superfamily domain